MVWRVALRFVALTHEAAEGNQFIASATCTKGNTRIALTPQMRFCHRYSSVEPRTHFRGLCSNGAKTWDVSLASL